MGFSWFSRILLVTRAIMGDSFVHKCDCGICRTVPNTDQAAVGPMSNRKAQGGASAQEAMTL